MPRAVTVDKTLKRSLQKCYVGVYIASARRFWMFPSIYDSKCMLNIFGSHVLVTDSPVYEYTILFLKTSTNNMIKTYAKMSTNNYVACFSTHNYAFYHQHYFTIKLASCIFCKFWQNSFDTNIVQLEINSLASKINYI